MRKDPLIFAFILFLICSTNLFSENIDDYLSRRIREDLSSPFMDKTMNGFTDIGSREIAPFVLLGLYTLGNEQLQETTKLSTVSIAGGILTCALLKLSTNRERPYGNDSRMNSSFPSGHATGAFAFTYVMGKKYPSASIPLYFTATTIAFSRVYLGKHYLSDVIVGSILGIVAGWIVMKNEETILKIEF